MCSSHNSSVNSKLTPIFSRLDKNWLSKVTLEFTQTTGQCQDGDFNPLDQTLKLAANEHNTSPLQFVVLWLAHWGLLMGFQFSLLETINNQVHLRIKLTITHYCIRFPVGNYEAKTWVHLRLSYMSKLLFPEVTTAYSLTITSEMVYLTAPRSIDIDHSCGPHLMKFRACVVLSKDFWKHLDTAFSPLAYSLTVSLSLKIIITWQAK